MFKLEIKEPNMFEFDWKDKTYSIPAVDSLPFATFMKIRMSLKNDAEEGFDEFMLIFEKYTPKVFNDPDFKISEASELFSVYAAGGTKLGESMPLSD